MFIVLLTPKTHPVHSADNELNCSRKALDNFALTVPYAVVVRLNGCKIDFVIFEPESTGLVCV